MGDRGKEIAELEAKLSALRREEAADRVMAGRPSSKWEVIAVVALLATVFGAVAFYVSRVPASPSTVEVAPRPASVDDMRIACVAAIPRARRMFVGAKSLDYSIGGSAFRPKPDSSYIACPVSTDSGYGLMAVVPTCSDVDKFFCSEATSIYINGKPLKPRG